MLDDASEALDSMRHPLMKANITDTSREDAFTDKVIKVRSLQERRRVDRRSTSVGIRQFDAVWWFPVRSTRLTDSRPPTRAFSAILLAGSYGG